MIMVGGYNSPYGYTGNRYRLNGYKSNNPSLSHDRNQLCEILFSQTDLNNSLFPFSKLLQTLPDRGWKINFH